MSTADADLAVLDVLVGTWAMEMHVSVEPPTVMRGDASFEWLPGGHFLVQRWKIDHDLAPDGIAIIGVGNTLGEFAQHYFDSRGVERVYGMRLDDGVLEITRRDAARRFVGTFDKEFEFLDGAWERAEEGGAWELDFPLTMRRT